MRDEFKRRIDHVVENSGVGSILTLLLAIGLVVRSLIILFMVSCRKTAKYIKQATASD